MAEPENSDSLPTAPWSGPIPTPDSSAPTPGGSRAPIARAGVWQPPAPEDVQPSFPLYEIRGLLGRGGMGAVYLGWQKSLDRFVAIKILPLQIEDTDQSFAERFKREAKAMARFSHAGIVWVYDAGETSDGLLYFVMEYVKGTDLQKILADVGALPAGQALGISRQIYDALAYAHERGVIHRDIKPSNIMIDANGQVKIADFGIAKVLNEETGALYTGTHVRMGTPDFMAPEALYSVGLVDHRADLYAVGVMLYQMLTGEVPRGRFDLPSVRRPGLDSRFDAIVDRAMQKDPEKRYASAVEIRRELERIEQDRPHGAAMPGVPPVDATGLPQGVTDSAASTGRVATGTPRRRWAVSEWLERVVQRIGQGSLARTAIYIGFIAALSVLIYSDTRSQPVEKIFLAILIFLTALAHLRINHPKTFEQNSRLLLLFGVMLLHLGLVKFILATADSQLLMSSRAAGNLSALERQQLWRLAIPYAWAPLVLSVVLGKSHGSYATIFVSLWGAIVYRAIDPIFLVVSLLCGSMAVLILLDGQGRIRLVRTGIVVGLLTWFLALIFGLIGPIIWESVGNTHWTFIGLQSIMAIGSGVITAFMVGGTLPIIDGAFGGTASLPLASPRLGTPRE